MIPTSPGRWLKHVFFWLQAGILLTLVCFVATHREPDLVDEGYYFYEAWLRMGPHPPVEIANAQRLLQNFGFILGIPYLLLPEPGVIGFRVYSMLLWLGGFGLFFYGYLRQTGFQSLLFPMLGLVLFSIYIPTISYQTIPIAFLAGAGGLFLLATQEERPAMLMIQGCLFALLLALSVLAVTPAMLPAAVALATTLLTLRKHHFHTGLITGLCIGLILLLILTPLSPEALVMFFTSNYGGNFDYALYGQSDNVIPRMLWRFFVLLSPQIKAFISGGLMLLTVSTLLNPSLLSAQQRWKRGLLYLTLVGLTTFSLTILFPWESQGQPFSRELILVASAMLPLLLLSLSRLQPALRTYYLLPLGWVILMALTESLLGNSWVEYYLLYAAPAVLGVTWILASHSEFIPKKLLHAGFSVILAASIFIFLNQGYQSGAGATQGTTPVTGITFRWVKASPQRANTLAAMQTAYHQHGCQHRFFASLDNLALPYYLFHRSSPFGTGWVTVRSDNDSSILQREASMCVFYRDNPLRTPPSGTEDIRRYLGIPQKPKRLQAIPLGEGIRMLVVDK